MYLGSCELKTTKCTLLTWSKHKHENTHTMHQVCVTTPFTIYTFAAVFIKIKIRFKILEVRNKIFAALIKLALGYVKKEWRAAYRCLIGNTEYRNEKSWTQGLY